MSGLIFYMVKRLWAMRITKLPIPLLIAAVALTGTVLIYVYLMAPPMPIHTDSNFTQPIFAGMTYLWRGAAFEYIFSADDKISVSYKPAYNLIYLTGPLVNITLSHDKAWIVYVYGERPLYIERRTLISTVGGHPHETQTHLIFKLTEVTPENSTIPGLTMWLPTTFSLDEDVTKKEQDAIRQLVSSLDLMRVVGIEVNGTHLIYKLAHIGSTNEYRRLDPLPSPISGKTIRVTNKPFSASYTVNGTTYSAMALPYQYFAIVPSGTTKLVIYVS